MTRPLLLALATIGAASSLHAEIPVNAAADLVLGQPNFTTGTAVSPGTPVKFNNPQGIAIDPLTGKLFIADTGNNRILRYRSATAVQSGELPEVVLGQANFSGQQPNQNSDPAAMPTDRTLNRPAGIFLDTNGRLWVADSSNRRVLMFENASQVGIDSPADHVLGQDTFTTRTTAATADGMGNPAAVWVDSSDRLWVSDYGDNRIVRFDAVSSKASGDPANGVLGQNGFGGTNGLLGPSFLDGPLGICVDAAGTLWVADGFNGRVVGYENAATLDNSLPPATRIFGQVGFNAAVTATATASQFRRPSDVLPDKAGNLWIVDQSARRAVRVSISQADSTAATGLLGEPDFTTIAGGTTAQLFNSPFSGMAIDPADHLWLADTGNSRILRFSAASAAVPSTAATVHVNGKPKFSTSKSKLKISGTAGPAGGLLRVEVKAGKGGYHAARGQAKWSLSVPLRPGKNVILVRAIGTNQLASSLARLTITRVP